MFLHISIYAYICKDVYVILCIYIHIYIHIHLNLVVCTIVFADLHFDICFWFFSLSLSHFFCSCPLFRLVHRSLEVYGNALGCVQGVPDSVTYFDYNAVYYGYYEMARCGDNCTQHTVYVPSDGVCVQCPDGTHANGVGALNCSVVSSARCSFVQFTCSSVVQQIAMRGSVAVQCSRGVLLCNSPVAVSRCVCFFCIFFMYGYEFLSCVVHVYSCACACVCARLCFRLNMCVSVSVYIYGCVCVSRCLCECLCMRFEWVYECACEFVCISPLFWFVFVCVRVCVSVCICVIVCLYLCSSSCVSVSQSEFVRLCVLLSLFLVDFSLSLSLSFSLSWPYTLCCARSLSAREGLFPLVCVLPSVSLFLSLFLYMCVHVWECACGRGLEWSEET